MDGPVGWLLDQGKKVLGFDPVNPVDERKAPSGNVQYGGGEAGHFVNDPNGGQNKDGSPLQVWVPGSDVVAEERFQNMGNQYRNANNWSEFAQPSFDQAQDMRAQQMGALGLQRDAATGNAPSQAEMLAHKQIQDSIASQMSMAASARGGPAAQAAAMRQAQMYGSGAQQQGIMGIQAGRANEMAQARDAYMSGASGMRGGDLNTANMRGQFGLSQAAENNRNRMGYETLGQNVATSQMNANSGNNTMLSNNDQFWAGMKNKNVQDKYSQVMSMGQGAASGATTGGGGTSGGGSAAGGAASGGPMADAEVLGSDARLKTGVQSLGRDAPMGSHGPWMPAEETMNALHPVSYNYRPESGEDPSKRRYGVMAQDLEKTPMGASVVVDTANGKHVDVAKSTGVQFAMLADLQDQINAMKGRR